MAYRKRKTMTKYRRKRKDNFTATADFARQGYYLAKRLKRLINVEVKFHDVDQTAGVTTASTGIVHDLTVIAQGDTQLTRNGSSLKPLHFSLKGTINQNSTQPTASVRCILFRGKLENGTTPTVTTYLESASIYAQINHDNKFQHNTLMDKTFVLTNVGSNRRVPFNIEQKLFGHVNYDDATTTIEAGGLYLLLITDNTSLTPVVTYYSRMTFTDN